MALCKLGWHVWRYWHMAVSFIAAFPERVNVERTCQKCGRMESACRDGTWNHRI